MESGIPKKILYVIDCFESPYAGTEGQLMQLLENLPPDRFDPEVLVLRNSKFVSEGGLPCSFTVLGRSKVLSPLTWISLLRFALCKKAAGYRLCHVFFNDSSILLPPIMAMLGIPTFISRRDMGFWYTSGYLTLLRKTRHFVSHVIANSEAVKGVTIEKEHFEHDEVSIIYNGYPTGKSQGFLLSDPEKKLLRNRLGLPAEGRFAILVANLREIKRIGDAISAMSILSDAVPDAQLVLVGAGEQRSYRELALRLGVKERVHFLGARSDVKEILPAMDVGLSCSESEGYSNAIVEYMRARLPVVASNVGGNAEAVVHTRTGYVYPCGEVACLASYLSKLLRNEEDVAGEMGEAGYRLASKRHDLSNMIEAHVRLYESFIGSHAESFTSQEAK
ncbi:glycosyltransferase [Marinobacter shengliensis]|uniref:glycosyltransferase n=1 Tax=Marinobacter shengliensis TaxID=1389223 RepID=UPI001FC8FA0D|nr:glycosyltransferase [Marinobacter shengliensis]